MDNNEEVVYGGKVSNRYGGKSIIASIPRTSWVFFFRAVCEEIITTVSEEVFERTHVCGNVSRYTYYIMKTYLYGPEEAYIMVLRHDNDIETCPMLKKGHIYTLSTEFLGDLTSYMTIITQKDFNRCKYIFDDTLVDELSMTAKNGVLVFDKDVMPDEYAFSRVEVKTLKEKGIDPYKDKSKLKGLLYAKYIARF